MADNRLEQMKQKYASVLTIMEQQQVRLSHVHIQDDKLFIQGVAPSEQAKNKVWEQIKLINPQWAQELTADLTVDASASANAASAKAAERTYTVKAGDTLSKISRDLYGNANDFMKIFNANRDLLHDPNKIQPGQSLKIPA
ncbi:MAG: LysM peptidoglycan-binding domain-containing protein [Acidobacteriota bacterium]